MEELNYKTTRIRKIINMLVANMNEDAEKYILTNFPQPSNFAYIYNNDFIKNKITKEEKQLLDNFYKQLQEKRDKIQKETSKCVIICTIFKQNYNDINKLYEIINKEFPNIKPAEIIDSLEKKLLKKYFADDEIEQAKNNYYKYKELTVMQNQQKHQTITEELILKKSTIIKDYLNTDYISISEYCRKNNINPENFSKMISYVRRFNDDLYQEYLDHDRKIKEKIYNANKDVIENMLHKMKNGVEEYGFIRQYNLIDYYSELNLNPYMHPQVFIQYIVDYLNSDEVRTFRDFIKKNPLGEKINISSDQNNDIRDLFNKNFDNEYDQNNNPIFEGITLEQKKEALEYLIYNKLPLYSGVYKQILYLLEYPDLIQTKYIK